MVFSETENESLFQKMISQPRIRVTNSKAAKIKVRELNFEIIPEFMKKIQRIFEENLWKV